MGLRRKKLHDEELYHIHFSVNIIWLIKYSRMPWRGYVAHVGWRRNVYRASMSGVLKEGVQLENPRIGRKLMLKKILKQQDGRAWIGWRDVVNGVINHVLYNVAILCTE